jgi:transposase
MKRHGVPIAQVESHTVSARASSVRALLEQWIRSGTTPQRVVRRSRIALMVLDHCTVEQIAALTGASRSTVKLWAGRFETGGPDALLHDAPGRGRHAILDAVAMYDRLRDEQLLGPDGKPKSIRQAAKILGVSASTLLRMMRKRSAQD